MVRGVSVLLSAAFAATLSLTLAPTTWADPLPTVAEALAEKGTAWEHRPGLLDLYVDSSAGTVLVALPAPGDRGEVGRFLYVEGLVQGLGSNPVGLDRGQMGDARLVALRRLGRRLLVEEQSPKYRALSQDAAEREAVAESFATSVLWAGPVVAEDPPSKNGPGAFLVDLTSFVVRDAHSTVAKLKETEQGRYSLDGERSALDPAACLAFPDNLELEALLTFALEPGAKVADHVKSTAPSGHSVTLVQHQSLVRLPAPGFQPREFHPESGFFEKVVVDYAAPLGAPLEKRWISRHRLEKVDPAAATSPVLEPIVFYLDPGTPEPVRGALLDGARWWADGFAAAGFEDAFRVEMLPPGVHPLDVRYNVIQWVHRSTRGWSYGGGVIDPRTGEIVRGQVTLGSLRVRQDRLIFEGLLGVEKTGTGTPDDPIELSLDRLRQLAAHEVGHALGLAHNFSASTWGRASVMDYPAPLVRVAEGSMEGKRASLDVSQAYAVGIGTWDVQALRYGYGQFSDQEEPQALAEILRQGREQGMVFFSDETARPAGAAQPRANLWDNSLSDGVSSEDEPDPVADLKKTLAVRRVALDNFGEGNIAPGQPLALLQEVLAPVYFYHRYQVDAAAKMLGGIDYNYAHRDDGRGPAKAVPAAQQRQALEALLGILEPEVLDLPDRILELLLPRPFGYKSHRELFHGATGPVFDPLAAAGSAADQVVAALLQPQRAARMVDLHRRDPSLPGFEEVIDALREATLGDPPEGQDPRLAEIQRAIQAVVVHRMIATAADPQTSTAVRSRLEGSLVNLWGSLQNREGNTEGHHRATLAGDIDRYLERTAPAMPPAKAAPDQPPGSPIGMGLATSPGTCSWQP